MLTPEQVAAVVEKAATLVEQQYVFPQVGGAVAVALRAKLGAGDYGALLDAEALAQVVTADMLSISRDQHLELSYDPHKAAFGEDRERTFQEKVQEEEARNFGFQRVECMAGNVGYLRLLGLPPPEVAGEILQAALIFLARVRALIIDLRDAAMGGTPGMVQLLISHLVDETPKPISGIYWRATDTFTPAETLATVTGKRFPTIPVYVLVSGVTFSGAEALAYDLQALKRATIVGARTRGGAHPTDFVPIANQFILMLPIARALNPLTNSNWEGVGVVPDIEVPADEALTVAYQDALARLQSGA